jgi:hypothetical protein
MASRRWESSVLKVIALFPPTNGQVEVSVKPDKTIRIDGFDDAAGQPMIFRPIGPRLYEDAAIHERAAFRRGADGKMQMQVGAADEVFLEVGPWQRKPLSYFVLVAGLMVVVATLAGWPLLALLRKHYERPLNSSIAERALKTIIRVVCALFCILFFGWTAVFYFGLGEFVGIMTGLGRWIVVFGVVGIFCLLGDIVLWWKVAQSWKGNDVSVWGRVHGTVVALACTALLWFAMLWNLMNFNQHY